MDNEVENEINAILIEAISNDIQHTIQKSQQAAVVVGATSDEKSKDQSPSDVPRCSVCCSQKPRYKCPACLMRVSSLGLSGVRLPDGRSAHGVTAGRY